MKLGGLIPFTLVDFPGRPAAVIFTAGCNLRCPFCHNPDLVTGRGDLSPEEALAFLQSRVGKLQGVCISGGEPTLHSGLEEFLSRIKDLGFAVKLDTNGTAPRLLARLVAKGLVDYVALDVKSAPEKYHLASGRPVNPCQVAESAAVLKGFGSYELRTTAVPGLVELQDLMRIGKWLGPVRRYALQQFRPAKTLDPQYGLLQPHDSAWFHEAAERLREFVEEVILRGALQAGIAPEFLE